MSDAFADTGTTNAAKIAKKPAVKRKPAKSAAPSRDTAKRPRKAAAVTALTLKKPTALSGAPTWFAEFYKAGSQKERDRELFSH